MLLCKQLGANSGKSWVVVRNVFVGRTYIIKASDLCATIRETATLCEFRVFFSTSPVVVQPTPVHSRPLSP